MHAATAYAWLMDGGTRVYRDPFDAHVLASALALAVAESKAPGISLSEATGLTSAVLTALVSAAFPHALPFLETCQMSETVSIPEDERCLRELLARSTSRGTPFQRHLAAFVARRAMRPNHLWQDMGLRNRSELSEALRKHFEPLASRNENNMKWKKFFYRMICQDEGFRLCTAPTCTECRDFANCFGDESGESLLARIRRESKPAGLVWLET